ncbi:MAG: M50 family metallopeptidase [Oscillospiraceae bacterium]
MSSNYILTLACLFVGLIFDNSGLLRMVLVASVMHEAGHILAYYIFTHKLPHIKISAGGISMSQSYLLPLYQENIIIILGPLTNIIIALITYIMLIRHASYNLYFFMAVNICIGAYNLLPFGVLDGSRLIKNNINQCKVSKLYKAQKYAIAIIIVLCAIIFFTKPLSQMARIAIVLAPVYLLFCELNE